MMKVIEQMLGYLLAVQAEVDYKTPNYAVWETLSLILPLALLFLVCLVIFLIIRYFKNMREDVAGIRKALESIQEQMVDREQSS